MLHYRNTNWVNKQGTEVPARIQPPPRRAVVIVPAALTTLRVLLLLPFLYFVSETTRHGRIAAIAMFMLAVATDILDGYAARALRVASDLGNVFDVLADSCPYHCRARVSIDE